MSGFRDFSKKKTSNTSVRITALHFNVCFKITEKHFRRDQIVQCLRVVCYGQIIPKGMET